MSVKLVKLALRRENDGTPIGHPAPTFFLCPCGDKIPAYDRHGQRITGKDSEAMLCKSCARRISIDGYLLEGRPQYHYRMGGAGFILYEGRQAIWETVDMAGMQAYLKEHRISDVEYRLTEIAVIH